MSLNANKSGGSKDFPKQDNIEAGNYPARLVQLIDLGLQPQRPFKGQDKKPVQEIMLTYELVDTFMKGDDGNEIEDKPRWISETLPFHGLFAENAKSTKRYLAFDPEQEWGGDFTKALGQPISLAVVNNASGDKVYDNVGAISPMRPRDVEKCPPLVNEAKAFDLDEPDMEIFNKLPKWIQEKIVGNLNFAGSALEGKLGGKPKAAAPAPAKAPVKAPKPDADPEGDNDAPY